MTAPSRPLGPTPAVIVLEGLDGVGKSTTARHLADHAGLADQVTPDAFDALDAAGHGSGAGRPPRKLWHSSPGSSGH